MNLNQLNIDLARALGVADPGKVNRITLTIEPANLPQIEVRRHVMTADGLQTAVEMLQLQPQDGGPPKLEEAAPAVVLLGDAERLRMAPGDVLVIKTPARVSAETADRIKAAWRSVGCPVVVLDCGVDFSVLSRTPEVETTGIGSPTRAFAIGEPDPFAEYGPPIVVQSGPIDRRTLAQIGAEVDRATRSARGHA
jgi:hypothetical protein